VKQQPRWRNALAWIGQRWVLQRHAESENSWMKRKHGSLTNICWIEEISCISFSSGGIQNIRCMRDGWSNDRVQKKINSKFETTFRNPPSRAKVQIRSKPNVKFGINLMKCKKSLRNAHHLKFNHKL
jgi:hypothetical protein